MVALVGLLGRIASACGGNDLTETKVAALSHALESAVARVPCGFQDHLAAVFGGVNAWTWTGDPCAGGFQRQSLILPQEFPMLEQRILVAYLGVPHESKDINGQWVARFLAGRDRQRWTEIAGIVHDFAGSLVRGDFEAAARLMNRETEIRMAMTPDVLDAFGRRLVRAAAASECGARFTGAGGGGCLWAIGEKAAVAKLRRRWSELLPARQGARLLDVGVDSDGLLCQL